MLSITIIALSIQHMLKSSAFSWVFSLSELPQHTDDHPVVS